MVQLYLIDSIYSKTQNIFIKFVEILHKIKKYSIKY